MAWLPLLCVALGSQEGRFPSLSSALDIRVEIGRDVVIGLSVRCHPIVSMSLAEIVINSEIQTLALAAGPVVSELGGEQRVDAIAHNCPNPMPSLVGRVRLHPMLTLEIDTIAL